MPKKGASTTHHCPRKSKGNCVYNSSVGYCTAHQQTCSNHPSIFHIIGEECPSCRGERKAREREEHRQEREARERERQAEERERERKKRREREKQREREEIERNIRARERDRQEREREERRGGRGYY